MMIQQKLTSLLQKEFEVIGAKDLPFTVDYSSDTKHGDYSTNAALIAAKKLGKNPMELGEEIAKKLQSASDVEKIEVARPGFINFWIKDDILINSLSDLSKLLALKTLLAEKKLLVEFAHPNTHKAFHIGHLRNITTGESIVRLLEAAGAKVVRANYQGDVGMHIAKCLYGILHNPELIAENAQLDIKQKVALLGKAYAVGSKAFEEDENAKKEIGKINKKIYAKDPSIWEVYQMTRQWSLDYFEQIYRRVGTKYDRLYFESEVYEAGKENVRNGLKKGIFQKSDGAIIFPGSKYGLHDRVFISSEGNPTYEGKEIGLGPLQFEEYKPNSIIHVVGPEQAGYFQVVFEALAQLKPETRGKEYHLVYGWVKLKHGKMSSRTGNVILGEWLLDEAKKRILEIYKTSDEVAEQVAVAAVKYSFLKVNLNQEIMFDLEESVSMDGNSGPYLQYVYVRTQSVLRKAKNEERTIQSGVPLQDEERDLLRLLARFDEIVSDVVERYAPSTLCTYLFELAQAFNLFYQKQPILKAEDAVRDFRLSLTATTGQVIKQGLYLLGIQTPEKM